MQNTRLQYELTETDLFCYIGSGLMCGHIDRLVLMHVLSFFHCVFALVLMLMFVFVFVCVCLCVCVCTKITKNHNYCL